MLQLLLQLKYNHQPLEKRLRKMSISPLKSGFKNIGTDWLKNFTSLVHAQLVYKRT